MFIFLNDHLLTDGMGFAGVIADMSPGQSDSLKERGMEFVNLPAPGAVLSFLTHLMAPILVLYYSAILFIVTHTARKPKHLEGTAVEVKTQLHRVSDIHLPALKVACKKRGTKVTESMIALISNSFKEYCETHGDKDRTSMVTSSPVAGRPFPKTSGEVNPRNMNSGLIYMLPLEK